VSADTQDVTDDERHETWALPSPATNPDPPRAVLRTDPDPDRLSQFVSNVMSAPRGTRLAVARSLGIEDPRSDDLAELLTAMAEELTPELVGLTVAEAQARIDAEPGLLLRLTPEHSPMTADFECGRISAWTRAGQILDANTG
jgi:hypothetical protein